MLVAPAIWKANRFWVLVLDWVLNRVNGIAVLPEATVAVMVVVAKETEEEAWRLPAIWRGAATVEEAEEIKPLPTVSIPVVEALAAVRVQVAVMFAALRSPEIIALPWAARSAPGEVVPIPTAE